jgi:hypothetical protein
VRFVGVAAGLVRDPRVPKRVRRLAAAALRRPKIAGHLVPVNFILPACGISASQVGYQITSLESALQVIGPLPLASGGRVR